MRPTLIFITILTQFLCSYASARVLSTSTTIKPGLVWKKIKHSNLFGAKANINILEVDLNLIGIKPIKARACDKTSSLGTMSGATAALNGTFHTSACTSRNLLKIDFNRFSKNIIRPEGAVALLINEANEVKIKMIKANENPPEPHGIGGFPRLVKDGEVEIQPQEDTDFFNKRFARSAIGLIDERHLLFVTVDGNSAQSPGLTISQLANYLKSLGAKQAMNLDGGVSTTMWITGVGVANRPASPSGERAIADVLALF